MTTFIILEFVLILVLVIVAFWQGSLIYAQFLGAPSVNSSREAIRTALKLSTLEKGETIIDLGCGSGDVLIIAAKEFGATGFGVERSPFYYFLAKANVWIHGQSKKVTIRFGDFTKLESELTKADVLYLYLLNSVLAKIEPWIFKTVKKETRIVSLAFQFPNHKPNKREFAITLGKKTAVRLYTGDKP